MERSPNSASFFSSGVWVFTKLAVMPMASLPLKVFFSNSNSREIPEFAPELAHSQIQVKVPSNELKERVLYLQRR